MRANRTVVGRIWPVSLLKNRVNQSILWNILANAQWGKKWANTGASWASFGTIVEEILMINAANLFSNYVYGFVYRVHMLLTITNVHIYYSILHLQDAKRGIYKQIWDEYGLAEGYATHDTNHILDKVCLFSDITPKFWKLR